MDFSKMKFDKWDTCYFYCNVMLQANIILLILILEWNAALDLAQEIRKLYPVSALDTKKVNFFIKLIKVLYKTESHITFI